jgi:hypothetical protein
MNEALAQFFFSGRVVDVAMAITVIEGVALAIYHRRTGNGVAPRHYVLNMVSGLFLMLALRTALTDAGWMLVALCLSASGVIHALDMMGRWQRTGHQPDSR